MALSQMAQNITGGDATKAREDAARGFICRVAPQPVRTGLRDRTGIAGRVERFATSFALLR
jgi:hypothetical protein